MQTCSGILIIFDKEVGPFIPLDGLFGRAESWQSLKLS
jgi:hypothetical protein